MTAREFFLGVIVCFLFSFIAIKLVREAEHYRRDYQVEVCQWGYIVYDRDRVVGVMYFDDCKLGEIILLDNQ